MNRLRYMLGLATLVAAVLVGWFLVGLLDANRDEEKFQIQVEFLDLRGLKSGAEIKYRGIAVGSVAHVDLTKDGQHAVATLAFDQDKSHLLYDNSRFWIVAPRFRGLVQGASGLDTLVRNTYIAFISPDPARATRLKPFAQLIGEERPFVLEEELRLPPVRRNDLSMDLLLAENHGVSVGARVLFRGMAVGEVRRIALAPGGTHVTVRLRIDNSHRSSVTDKSVFWVARPRLSGAILTGFSVSDLGALFAPFISYHTPSQAGSPVEDNYKVLALSKSPDLTLDPVPASALKTEPGANRPKDGIHLVRINYSAIEEDTLSPNDSIYRSGSGVLYVDHQGRTMVVTARSVCDARYDLRETFGGSAEITDEKITVTLADRRVLRANRIAVAKALDLAVLQVQQVPHTTPMTAPDRFGIADKIPDGTLTVYAMGKGAVAAPPVELAKAKEALESKRGGAVVAGNKVVGILGRKSADDGTAAIVPLTAIPDSMRPRR